MLPFTEDDLRRELPPNYVKRGEEYWARGLVDNLKCSADNTIIQGRVQGNARAPYRVKVRIVPDRKGRVTIQGDCTCPMLYNCKHVAALLMEALEHEPESDDDEIDSHAVVVPARPGKQPPLIAPPTPDDTLLRDWLARVERATAPAGEIAVAADVPERLLYILHLDTIHRFAQAWVEMLVVRPLKGGGYGKAQTFSGGLTSSARCIGEADRAILRWLEVLRYESAIGNFGRHTLSGADGARVLAQMLATGRCHYANKDSPPLALGEAQQGTPSWRADGNGYQRPVFEGVEILLPLTPPWYVDTTRHVCGPLLTGLPDAVAGALCAAPSIAPDQVAAVRTSLRQHFAEEAPALPRIFTIAPARRGTPVPHLRLLKESLALRYDLQSRLGQARLDTELARVQFDYDGERVAAADPRRDLTRAEGDTLVRIARNASAERHALDALGEWGFVPLADLGMFNNPPKACEHDWCMDAEDRPQALINFGIRGIAALRAAGWQVEIDDDYPYRVVEASDDWYAEIDDGAAHDWFGVELGITLAGERVNLLPLMLAWLREAALTRADLAALDDDFHALARLPDGRLLPVPIARVRAVLSILTELYDDKPLDPHGRLQLPRAQAGQLTGLDAALGDKLAWHGGKKLRELGRRLRDFQGIRPVPAPAGLKAELRAYQQDGLNWLQFLREYELGGILADDMGLGKTVQALAHLLVEKEAGRLDKPALVVAPTSLMVNWRREAERFAPSLKTLTLHGDARHQAFARLADHDVVFTTYPLLPRDAEVLLAQEYHMVILDEAQVIKNPKAKSTEIARAITARHRLCLTGTPMENHLGELWSLFHFLMPGLLGDERQFRRLFRTPIEKHADPERRLALAQRVAPFLLRRTKEQVATELPPKTEIVRPVELDGAQRDLYESIRLAMHDKVRREIEKKGLARSQIVILDALLKLRQVCCDPRLLKLDSAKKVKHSAKLELLMDMLPELIEEGRRVLLFSQFTSMLALIEAELKERNIDYVLLTGDTKDRATPIDRFQSGAVPLFLISLKAGGTGLNLTAADTVIHYDPWWNPAVENQATDRAHRIGQDKKVFVYKLMTVGTVEEKIAALQARKKELVEGLLNEERQENLKLTPDDLDVLFAPLQ